MSEFLNVFGKNQEEIGSLDKNLVLRTKGRVYIRYGRKYIDVLDNNGNLNVKVPKYFYKVDSLDNITSDGLYLYNGNLYTCIDGEIIQLTGSNGEYISYTYEQNLSQDEIDLAQKNIGLTFGSIEDAISVIDNGIVFIGDEIYYIENGNYKLLSFTLNEPLTSINDSNLEYPSENSILIFRNGNWQYLNFDNIFENENSNDTFDQVEYSGTVYTIKEFYIEENTVEYDLFPENSLEEGDSVIVTVYGENEGIVPLTLEFINKDNKLQPVGFEFIDEYTIQIENKQYELEEDAFIGKHLFVKSEENSEKFNIDYNTGTISLQNNVKTEEGYESTNNVVLGDVTQYRTYQDNPNNQGFYSDQSIFVGGEFRKESVTKDSEGNYPQIDGKTIYPPQEKISESNLYEFPRYSKNLDDDLCENHVEVLDGDDFEDVIPTIRWIKMYIEEQLAKHGTDPVPVTVRWFKKASDESPIYTEQINSGEKAQYPLNQDYVNPTLAGYYFTSWNYDYLNRPVFGNLDIIANWEPLILKIEVSSNIVSSEGGNVTITYWAYPQSNPNIIIHDGIILQKTSLEEDQIEIDISGTTNSVIDGKNQRVITISENEEDYLKYYKIYATCEGNLDVKSVEEEIKQTGSQQIYLPDFDFMTFRYLWTSQDGQDLDSATYVLNSGIKVDYNGNQVPLDNLYVGYGSGNVENIVKPYLEHGGDNNSSGNEGALIKMKNICQAITSSVKKLYFDVYANWYGPKGLGKVSVELKTYKGTGMIKEGYIFKPDNTTTLVSTETLNNIEVFARGSSNTSKVKEYYSKIATVEYDVKARSAILSTIGKRNGREIITNIKLNNENVTGQNMSFYITLNSGSVKQIDHIGGSGSFILSLLSEQINTIGNNGQIIEGQVQNYGYNESTLVLRQGNTIINTPTITHVGNDIVINYIVPQNSGTVSRSLEVYIETLPTTAYSQGHGLIYKITQLSNS